MPSPKPRSKRSKFPAPLVSQGCIGSDKAQGTAFREAADAFRIKTCSVRPGKGAARRHRAISSKEFEDNWNEIRWH